MAANDDPEDRIRELERPLADAARASEASSAQPAGQAFQPPPAYPPGPAGPTIHHMRLPEEPCGGGPPSGPP
ncbi:hypothetical protein A5679_14065 [Mycobacterium scrofulaceum]|uniref:Uncharacterized protein n=1 Tax=Mycobacterium scrofulaceum TaxID=1783 RepID=A0A1A2VWV9_MYCSC|nr:hypothetical protein A5679_14065 [Mycobacterium scrofulaceum]